MISLVAGISSRRRHTRCSRDWSSDVCSSDLIVAKKIAGAVVKEVVAHQIAKQTKNELLGGLAKLAMYAADQPDLRSWNLLPKDLQIARIIVRSEERRVGKER